MSRNTWAALAALSLVTLAGAAIAQSSNEGSGGLSSADRKFLTKAAEGNAAEVETGRLAAQQAMDPQVKQFGNQMVQDHSQANEKLTALAQSKGVQLPTTPDKSQQSEMNKLQGMSGSQFDKAYSTAMLKDHKKDVKEYEHQAKNAKDPDVKAYAEEVLPTLQHHLAMAEQLPQAHGSSRAASADETGTESETHAHRASGEIGPGTGPAEPGAPSSGAPTPR